MTVSILVATIGRPSLERALRSITSETREGDQVLVIGATLDIQVRADKAGCQFHRAPLGHDWGGSERASGIHHATGDYVAFLDDDDVYLPGWRAAMEAAMTANNGRPIIFKMHIAWTGGHLWETPALRMGNVGTPMLVLPNVDRVKRGVWGRQYGGDFMFVESLGWHQDAYVWDATPLASIRPK